MVFSNGSYVQEVSIRSQGSWYGSKALELSFHLRYFPKLYSEYECLEKRKTIATFFHFFYYILVFVILFWFISQQVSMGSGSPLKSIKYLLSYEVRSTAWLRCGPCLIWKQFLISCFYIRYVWFCTFSGRDMTGGTLHSSFFLFFYVVCII